MVNKFDRERLAEIEQRLERAVTGEAYANPFIQSDLHACIRIIKDLEHELEGIIKDLERELEATRPQGFPPGVRVLLPRQGLGGEK